MQLSQQASYKAEIHELCTEMLNMREKSEMKEALSAQMCRLETLSRSVESEPEYPQYSIFKQMFIMDSYLMR